MKPIKLDEKALEKKIQHDKKLLQKLIDIGGQRVASLESNIMKMEKMLAEMRTNK